MDLTNDELEVTQKYVGKHYKTLEDKSLEEEQVIKALELMLENTHLNSDERETIHKVIKLLEGE